MNPAAPEKYVLLNQVFWLVFYDSLSWRSMSNLACDAAEEVEQLADSQYLSIATFRSGRAAVRSLRFPRYPRTSSRTLRAWLQ